MDSSNLFAVCMTEKGDSVLIHNVLVNEPLVVDRDEAINLAAWIQVLADPGGERTGQLIAEIKKR